MCYGHSDKCVLKLIVNLPVNLSETIFLVRQISTIVIFFVYIVGNFEILTFETNIRLFGPIDYGPKTMAKSLIHRF